jgi:hypothetical protein
MVVPDGAVVLMRHMKQRLHGAPRDVSSEGTSAPRGTCGRKFCFGGPGPPTRAENWKSCVQSFSGWRAHRGVPSRNLRSNPHGLPIARRRLVKSPGPIAPGSGGLASVVPLRCQWLRPFYTGTTLATLE